MKEWNDYDLLVAYTALATILLTVFVIGIMITIICEQYIVTAAVITFGIIMYFMVLKDINNEVEKIRKELEG